MSRGQPLDKRKFCGYVVFTMSTRKKATGKPTKGDVVRMRVTAEQKRALEDAAARDGLDVSAWLRRLALREAGALPATRGQRRDSR
jgi:hypothetical protein